MTLTIEREPGGVLWCEWKVTCHPTGEGLDGVTWQWCVARDASVDPARWRALPPGGVDYTPPALARWQRAVIEAVAEWERGEAAEGRAAVAVAPPMLDTSEG